MKKNKLIVLSAFFVSASLVGCNSSGSTKYKVTFYSDGKEYKTTEVEKGKKVAKPDNPTKEGYTFDKWHKDSETGEEYNFDSVVNADLKLYAGWVTSGYTVTFDADNGSEPTKVTVAKEGKVSEPTDKPTKKHTEEGKEYTFKYWAKDGEEKAYDFNTTVTSDFTLKAKYDETVKEYTVEFKDHEGKSLKTITKKHGEVIKAEDQPEKPKPYVEGYDDMEFDHWEDDDGATLVLGTTAVKANTNYNAVHKKNGEHTFTATLILEGVTYKTVTYTKSNWETTQRDAILNLLPPSTDEYSYMFKTLIPTVAPKADPTYNIEKVDTYFTSDLSTATKVDPHLVMVARSGTAPSLSYDSTNKCIDYAVDNDNLVLASKVSDFNLEFTTQTTDDRITVVIGLDDDATLNKTYSGGGKENCENGVASFVIVPGHAAPIRLFKNKEEVQFWANNAAQILNNPGTKTFSDKVKVSISVENGIASVSFDGLLMCSYDLSNYYTGGHIALAKGQTKVSTKLFDTLSLTKPFTKSFDYDFAGGGTDFHELNVNGRTGARNGDSPATLSVSDNLLKAVAGNTDGIENYHTSCMYKDFDAEFELNAPSAKDSKINFFLTNSIAERSKSHHEGGEKSSKGDFRAVIATNHATGIVRPNYDGDEKPAQKLDGTTVATFKSINTDYIKIKVSVNNYVVSIYLKDADHADYLKEGEFTLTSTGDNAYKGGYIGIGANGTANIKNFKVTAK